MAGERWAGPPMQAAENARRQQMEHDLKENRPKLEAAVQKARIQALEAEVGRLRELVASQEWVWMPRDGEHRCPECLWTEEDEDGPEHAPDCKWGAACKALAKEADRAD